MVALALTIGLSSTAHAQDPMMMSEGTETSHWVSPGIKLAYTFREGFTLGVEVSVGVVPRVPGGDLIDLIKRGLLVGYGFVFSFDHTWAEQNIWKVHAGVEWIGPGIGLEFGPSLVRIGGESFLGFALTPWLGTYLIPTLNWTGVVGRDNLLEMGVLLKLHLCVTPGETCETDGDDPDFD